MGTKKCARCSDTKDTMYFYANKRMKDGISRVCKACQYVWDTAYRLKKADEIKDRRAVACVAYRDSIRGYQQSYYQNNKAFFAQKTRNRQASKRTRTPYWLDKAHVVEMEGVYEYCRIFNEFIHDPSDKLEVDHIVPLNGKTVSGLHVPWNLQVITCKENAEKRNTLLGDTLR